MEGNQVQASGIAVLLDGIAMQNILSEIAGMQLHYCATAVAMTLHYQVRAVC